MKVHSHYVCSSFSQAFATDLSPVQSCRVVSCLHRLARYLRLTPILSRLLVVLRCSQMCNYSPELLLCWCRWGFSVSLMVILFTGDNNGVLSHPHTHTLKHCSPGLAQFLGTPLWTLATTHSLYCETHADTIYNKLELFDCPATRKYTYTFTFSSVYALIACGYPLCHFIPFRVCATTAICKRTVIYILPAPGVSSAQPNQ